MSFSQGGEENAILEIVNDKGYPCTFLDVGAFDGVKYSNTHALALAGWGGVCVEPDPRNFVALRETYKDRPNIALVNASLGFEVRVVNWLDLGDEFSRPAMRSGQSSLWTAQIDWSHLLNAFEGPWTVVSIDTEGTSAALFLAMPIKEMAPHAICVEHDGRAVELASYAAPYGYKVACLNQENIVLWK
jgi:FkbM family methyltransferase